MALVADNSVIMAWFIPSQATDYTRRIARRAKRDPVIAPSDWPFEFVNVLRVHRRRRLLAEHQVARVLRPAERALSVDREPVALPSLDAVAAAHDLSAYDAAYLELALRLGLPLAVRDGNLRKAAITTGVLA